MPVLVDTRGASRKVTAGQSYYAGDGLNKALVTPAGLREVLDQVMTAINTPAEEVSPVPVPPPVEDYEAPLNPRRPNRAPAGSASRSSLGLRSSWALRCSSAATSR